MKFCVLLTLFALAVAHPLEEGSNHVGILRQSQESHLDGSYKYGFETEDGTVQEQSGSLETVDDGRSAMHVEGAAIYESPEGESISLTYTSGVKGYIAEGDYVPKTPDYVIELVKYLLAIKEEEERGGHGHGKQIDVQELAQPRYPTSYDNTNPSGGSPPGSKSPKGGRRH